MGEITSKAAVATKQAIWDYDPEDEGNLINGALDVIAIVRTLAVKVCIHLLSQRGVLVRGRRERLFTQGECSPGVHQMRFLSRPPNSSHRCRYVETIDECAVPGGKDTGDAPKRRGGKVWKDPASRPRLESAPGSPCRVPSQHSICQTQADASALCPNL